MQNNLELLKRARTYIFAMAQGFDPFTDHPIEDDSLLDNPRIIRCLHYVADILDQVIANDGIIAEPERIFFVPPGTGIRPVRSERDESKPKKAKRTRPFSLTHEQIGSLTVESDKISLSVLRGKINALIPEDMKKLDHQEVMRWLTAQGMMIPYAGNDGKSTWRPTAIGQKAGFLYGEWIGMQGTYMGTKLTTEAQQYILSHLPEIIAFNENPQIDMETGEVPEA